jgi:hypothetical protein
MLHISNINQQTVYPYWSFHGFPQSLLLNAVSFEQATTTSFQSEQDGIAVTLYAFI